eukprot:tig00021504_g21971.t1
MPSPNPASFNCSIKLALVNITATLRRFRFNVTKSAPSAHLSKIKYVRVYRYDCEFKNHATGRYPRASVNCQSDNRNEGCGLGACGPSVRKSCFSQSKCMLRTFLVDATRTTWDFAADEKDVDFGSVVHWGAKCVLEDGREGSDTDFVGCRAGGSDDPRKPCGSNAPEATAPIPVLPFLRVYKKKASNGSPAKHGLQFQVPANYKSLIDRIDVERVSCTCPSDYDGGECAEYTARRSWKACSRAVTWSYSSASSSSTWASLLASATIEKSDNLSPSKLYFYNSTYVFKDGSVSLEDFTFCDGDASGSGYSSTAWSECTNNPNRPPEGAGDGSSDQPDSDYTDEGDLHDDDDDERGFDGHDDEEHHRGIWSGSSGRSRRLLAIGDGSDNGSEQPHAASAVAPPEVASRAENVAAAMRRLQGSAPPLVQVTSLRWYGNQPLRRVSVDAGQVVKTEPLDDRVLRTVIYTVTGLDRTVVNEGEAVEIVCWQQAASVALDANSARVQASIRLLTEYSESSTFFRLQSIGREMSAANGYSRGFTLVLSCAPGSNCPSPTCVAPSVLACGYYSADLRDYTTEGCTTSYVCTGEECATEDGTKGPNTVGVIAEAYKTESPRAGGPTLDFNTLGWTPASCTCAGLRAVSFLRVLPEIVRAPRSPDRKAPVIAETPAPAAAASGPNVAAIVGGVVGGVACAVLAAVAAFAVRFVHQRRAVLRGARRARRALAAEEVAIGPVAIDVGDGDVPGDLVHLTESLGATRPASTAVSTLHSARSSFSIDIPALVGGQAAPTVASASGARGASPVHTVSTPPPSAGDGLATRGHSPAGGRRSGAPSRDGSDTDEILARIPSIQLPGHNTLGWTPASCTCAGLRAVSFLRVLPEIVRAPRSPDRKAPVIDIAETPAPAAAASGPNVAAIVGGVVRRPPLRMP